MFEELVYAIEGPVCAGKSTLIERCKRDGIKTIPEYGEYVIAASKSFPNFPPKDEEEAKKNFQFLLDIEALRQQEHEAGKSSLTALDRSILTLISFEAGAARLTGINIFDWALDEAIKNRAGVIFPDHVFYIDIPMDIARRRAELAGMGTSPFLFSKDFNDGVRVAFDKFEMRWPGLVTYLDGSKNQEAVYCDFNAEALIVYSLLASLSKAPSNPVWDSILK